MTQRIWLVPVIGIGVVVMLAGCGSGGSASGGSASGGSASGGSSSSSASAAKVAATPSETATASGTHKTSGGTVSAPKTACTVLTEPQVTAFAGAVAASGKLRNSGTLTHKAEKLSAALPACMWTFQHQTTASGRAVSPPIVEIIYRDAAYHGRALPCQATGAGTTPIEGVGVSAAVYTEDRDITGCVHAANYAVEVSYFGSRGTQISKAALLTPVLREAVGN